MPMAFGKEIEIDDQKGLSGRESLLNAKEAFCLVTSDLFEELVKLSCVLDASEVGQSGVTMKQPSKPVQSESASMYPVGLIIGSMIG